MQGANDASLVIGRRAVAEALEQAPGQAGELLLAKGDHSPALDRLQDLAKACGVKVRRLERAKLDALSGRANHQGVALRMAAYSYAPLTQVLMAVRQAGPRALVVLADHIQDPHNLGAIIRSAAAAGAQGLVMPKDRACPLTPAAAKAAAGALLRLPVCRVTNLGQALAELKEAGMWGLAAATRGGPAPWELDLNLPLALVVGGEHKGIGPGMLKACELSVTLPLAEGSESLNASVAAGVLLFEIVRQRGG